MGESILDDEAPRLWGQRLANFVDVRVGGERFELYRDVTRGAILILANPDTSAVEEAMALANRAGSALNVLILGRQDPGPGIRLPDASGRVRETYFGERGGEPMVLLSDADQRCIDATSLSVGWTHRISDHLADLARPQPERRQSTAPVMIVRNLLDPAQRRRLLDAFDGRHEEGTVSLTRAGEVADTVLPQFKKRRDVTLDPKEELYQVVMSAIAQRLMPELHKAWWIEKLRTESFYIAGYSADRGDFFAPHRANTLPQTAKRRVAVSIELNDDYEGGGLVFPEYSDDAWRAPPGGGLVFSCSLMHEALPTTKGVRYVLLAFLNEP